MCTQEGDYTRVYLRTSTLKEMNNDDDVDTDEDNCDLDYRATGDLILKTRAKVYLTPRTIYSSFSPHDWKPAKIR